MVITRSQNGEKKTELNIPNMMNIRNMMNYAAEFTSILNLSSGSNENCNAKFNICENFQYFITFQFNSIQ